MMLTGCTYICWNAACTAFKKELWLNPAWPTGATAAVRNSTKVVADVELSHHLAAEERPQSLIQLPNDGEVPHDGWRFHLYCQDCHVIWQEDAAGNGAPDPSGISRKCSRCAKELKTSDEIIAADGDLPCPHCNCNMRKRYWFVQGKI